MSWLFTTTSVWEHVRTIGYSNRVLNTMWATPSPLLTRLTIWRLLSDILPVELKAKSSGYQLASCCVCCANPKEESIQHLFLKGDLAVSLWSFFGAIFNIHSYPGHTTYSRLAFWFRSCQGNSHFAILGRMTAIFICRLIWTIRNKAMYGASSLPYWQQDGS